MSREPLNGFAPNSQGPNSQGRRVWFLAWTTLKVKVEGHFQGQGHQEQKQHFSAFSAACVRFCV